eukprot:COSAG02_NODE_27963_length_599_cov_0.918000_2_plen_78_part_01
MILHSLNNYLFKCFPDASTSPAVAAAVASGYFDLAVSVITAFHTRGTQCVLDTSSHMLFHALGVCKYCRGYPGIEKRI